MRITATVELEVYTPEQAKAKVELLLSKVAQIKGMRIILHDLEFVKSNEVTNDNESAEGSK